MAADSPVSLVRCKTYSRSEVQAAVGRAVLLLGGIQLITIGILGEYLGRVFEQGKQRPLYIVTDKVGFTDQ